MKRKNLALASADGNDSETQQKHSQSTTKF